MVTFLIYHSSFIQLIGDHPEGNDFCSIYHNSCRMCYQKDGVKILRNKENSKELFNEMIELQNRSKQKKNSYLLSKSVKQHIVKVNNINTK